MILQNGKFYTQDPNHPWVDCLWIEDGLIRMAGSKDQVFSQAGRNQEIIDLNGRLVLPGFVDSHIHLELFANFLSNVDCETATQSECLKRIADRSRAATPGMWITGHGWNHNVWPEGVGNRTQLDEVTEGHPAYFTSKSVHSGWANSIALKMAHIDRTTPDPIGGVIVRDPYGEPTGILLETAMELVEQIIPEKTEKETEDSIYQAQLQLAKMGITSVHDFDQVSCLKALQSLHDQAELKVRVVKSIPFPYLDEVCQMGISTGFGDEWLQIGSLKLFADGALGPQTAAMIAPYSGAVDEFGILMLTEEDLVEIGKKAIVHRISVATHAIGDRANQVVLNAYAKYRELEAALGIQPLAHRIEHVQCIQPADQDRMRQLQIIASMQPIHAISDWQMADRHWGERTPFSYAWGSILSRGIPLIFGSDAPVESPDPLRGIHAAITRKADDYPEPTGWVPQERITIKQAISAYTIGPAMAVNHHLSSGRLSAGQFADLVILDQDLFKVSAEQLRTVSTFATMVAGQWTWKTDE